MNAYANLIFKLLFSVAFIIAFYQYVKSYLIRYAGKIALKLKISQFHPYETSKGVVELPAIVFLHLLFCLLFMKVTHVTFEDLGLTKKIDVLSIIEGILLGIGVMGTASLIGRLYIEWLRYLFPNRYPSDIKNWLAMARSGWIRHYFHTLEVLPIWIALSVTLGQVCAEEIVFRGILINYFLPQGKIIALTIATLLFMYMQIFQMPNRLSSAFPVIGAFVMGTVGGILYLHSHNLLPLIIAHITFFTVAVL
jgi:membrane protease YdiL (CAAX protease family)